MQKHQEDMARNAESTSLNKALGYSRDPFAALPKQLLSHETFLLDHCMFIPLFMRTTNSALKTSVLSFHITSEHVVSSTK